MSGNPEAKSMNELSDAAPAIGHNRAPEAAELARERVDALIKNADAWVARVPKIEDEETAKQAQTFLRQLSDQYKAFDEQRQAEKRPHDEAAAAVQAKWRPLLERLKTCSAAIGRLREGWLRLAQARVDEERRQRQREAEDARQHAAEVAAKAQIVPGGYTPLENIVAAQEANEAAERARKAAAAVPERAQVRDNFGGPARSLRYRWLARIVDFDSAYAHFRDRLEVKELLDRLTNEVVRAKDGPRPQQGEDSFISEKLPFALIYREES